MQEGGEGETPAVLPNEALPVAPGTGLGLWMRTLGSVVQGDTRLRTAEVSRSGVVAHTLDLLPTLALGPYGPQHHGQEARSPTARWRGDPDLIRSRPSWSVLDQSLPLAALRQASQPEI